MRKSLERPLLVTSVYAGVVLLLALLALFFRGFSESVGEARLSGRYAAFPLFHARSLERLTVSWNGLALQFSRGSTPALQGVETTDAGTDVLFDGNVRLRLAPAGDTSGSLAFSAIASNAGAASSGASASRALLIPFSFSGPLSKQADGTALSWNRAGVTYLLSLPSGARADTDSRVLSLPLGAGASLAQVGVPVMTGFPARVRVAARVPAARATPRAAATRLPDEKSMPADGELQAALSRFVDAAYAGWMGVRFSASMGTWKAHDGTAAFSEDVGVALLAESLQRGSFGQALQLWTDALAKNQNGAALTLSTSPFVGGLPAFFKLDQARAAALVGQASSLLSKSDNALCAIPGLIPLLEDHASTDLLQQALAFITAANVTSLDSAESVGLLEALVALAQQEQAAAGSSQPGSSQPGSAAKLRELVEKKILTSVRTTDAGVFLDSGAGRVDVRESLRCGSLLLKAGAALDNSLAAAVGRGLIVSALGLAADDAWLPATLTVSGGKVTGRDGSLAPESVYGLLPMDRRLPREISLARTLGPGAWMWGAARIVSVQSSATQTKLVLAFPAGAAHHFLLQGVPAFKRIQLHGIPWHTDPTYYNYSDGWAYDASTDTLYFKLTGRQANEEIDIFY